MGDWGGSILVVLLFLIPPAGDVGAGRDLLNMLLLLSSLSVFKPILPFVLSLGIVALGRAGLLLLPWETGSACPFILLLL